MCVCVCVCVCWGELSHHLCRLQTHCSHAARPDNPEQSHTTFCIVVLLPEVRGRRRQVVGMLPSEGDTALLPSHSCGVQSCLFSFIAQGYHLLCPLMTIMVAVKAWNQTVSIPSRQQTAATSLHDPPPHHHHRHPNVAPMRLKLLSERPYARKKAGTQNNVTARARQEGRQELRYFILFRSDGW